MSSGAGIIAGKLPMRLKLIQGFGAVAFGVKDNGFSFFLLIFYNQVLGMDASLVSLALLIALLVDAVVDPILGNLSDRTYTRWGRRLPWLYAAPIPLAFAWVMMWSPPTGEAPSFGGLVMIAIAVRVLLSACEVPSVSLVPEITADYDERTTLFRYRAMGGWIGGLGMMVLAYTVFMPGPEGLLQREGYYAFGIFGAILMAVSVIGSAIGQHGLVARLPDAKPCSASPSRAFAEIAGNFRTTPSDLCGAWRGLYPSRSQFLDHQLYQSVRPTADPRSADVLPAGAVWRSGADVRDHRAAAPALRQGKGRRARHDYRHSAGDYALHAAAAGVLAPARHHGFGSRVFRVCDDGNGSRHHFAGVGHIDDRRDCRILRGTHRQARGRIVLFG